MTVVWLFLAVPRVFLQFVIVVFPDHTHLLFSSNITRNITFAVLILFHMVTDTDLVHSRFAATTRVKWALLVYSII